VMGVNARGEKHFLEIEDGVREPTQSWREVLLTLKSRGMNVPELAIGDGAMGFWAALEAVYPETRQQRCPMHKTMNVLNCLPKSAQPKAKQALHWQSIRTSNPIESTFGTTRHPTKRSKGCLSRDGVLHVMFKLGLCAEKKWRRLRGFDYLAKVVTGIQFKDGVEVTEVDQPAA